MKFIVKVEVKQEHSVDDLIIKTMLSNKISELNRDLFKTGVNAFVEVENYREEIDRIVGYPKPLPQNLIDWTEEDKVQYQKNRAIEEIRKSVDL